MAIIVYYAFLTILFLLLIFFVVPIHIRVKVDILSITVSVYKVPIMRLKGERFYRFIKNKIPKNRLETKQMYNFLDLVHYVHFQEIKIKQFGNKHDPTDVMIYGFLSILNSSIPLQKLALEFNEGPQNVVITTHMKGNLGIILINFFIIRRENNVETIFK